MLKVRLLALVQKADHRRLASLALVQRVDSLGRVGALVASEASSAWVSLASSAVHGQSSPMRS